ncbi:MAG: hypothetical protein OES26_20980 [Gammaproteobacteria bacterium]|nr:hypothetical protein [Gammaproteobacteria bacterium]
MNKTFSNFGVAIMLLMGAMAPETRISAQSFEFVALGDTAYCPEVDVPKYERLIDKINAASPAFSIHVGDIGKPTTGACSEEVRQTVYRQFNQFKHPLIYTPGDNEWTDCVYNLKPLAQLERLRTLYFSKPKSLGRETIPLVRQSDESGFDEFVENLRWEWNDVLFATVHVVGSHNGLDPGVSGAKVPASNEALAEYQRRNDANIAWIERSFNVAKEHGSKAVVVVFHANIYQPEVENSPGFRGIKQALAEQTESYGGQVLFVNGDSHKFLVDKPLVSSHGPGGTQTHMNVTRLVVFGEPNIRAVKVTVDTNTPWVFGFQPLFEAGERRSVEEQEHCTGP